MKFSTKYYLLDEEAMQKLNPQRDKNENSSPILKHFETLLPKENIEKKNLETQSTIEPISTIAIDQIEHTSDQPLTSNQKISSEQIIVPSPIVQDKLKKKDQIGKGI